MTTLIIDNYDSFTYNLYQLMRSISDEPVLVIENDDLDEWELLDFSNIGRIVVSPGPGRPDRLADFGLSRAALESRIAPVLGVCLGHQGLCLLAGAQIVAAPVPIHGRVSPIFHSGNELFAGIPNPFDAVRYHSLVAVDVPSELDVIAGTADGLVMAVRHTEWPAWGVQFHPESICTAHGRQLMGNFIELTGGVLHVDGHRPRHRQTRPAPPSNGLRAEWEALDHFPDPATAIDALFADSNVSFWLDTPGTGSEEGRYSYVGGSGGPLATIATYRVENQHVEVESEQRGTTSEPGSVFDFLDRHLGDEFLVTAAPFPLNLGYVGWLGYELKSTVGGDRQHSSPYPDAMLLRADRLLVLDHHRHVAWLATLEDEASSDLAHEWRRWAVDALGDAKSSPPNKVATITPVPHVAYRDDLSAYEDKIVECQRLIRAGETYEVCLTNKLSMEAKVDPLTLFTILRAVNPAPFAAYIRTPDVTVVGSSPERFLAVENDTVFSKPMKGTRKRGASEAEDRQLRDDLQQSEKDRAENLMITDLVRNDFGRFAEPGSVKVDKLFDVETFQSAHQMTTQVTAALPPGVSIVDCVRAAFPAGSMTGAPKKRTMEILDRLEGAPRGIYSGALGFLTLDGRLDLSVVIRTMLVSSNRVEIGVGGAITALSDPSAEVDEMLLKASALITALGQAMSVRDTDISGQVNVRPHGFPGNG